MKRTLLMFFILITCASIFIATTLSDSRSTLVNVPLAVDGILDLSQWDFDQEGSINLNGEWSFYFNQMLTHEDFEGNKKPSKSVLVTLPANQKSMALVKPLKDNKFYGTMRLIVKLPQGKHLYGIRSNIILSANKLYVDGRQKYEVGKVGISSESSRPRYKVMSTYFNTDRTEVELIYQASDFTFEDCIISAPRLGNLKAIMNESRMGLGRDLFLFGMLLIMGIYHLGLYVMRRKDRAPLYFGIFCLLFSTRMLIVGERFLPDLWTMDVLVYTRICYLCAYLGTGALFGFVYHALSGLFPKTFIRICAGISLAASLVALCAPYKMYDGILLPFSALSLLLIGYAIMRMLYGVYKKVEFSGLVLFGFVCMTLAMLNDLIYQYTLVNRASMIPVGIFIFTLTQSLTLSSKFSKAFAMAEQLTCENEKILLELKNSNVNLEDRVATRTMDLKLAMEELERMSMTDYLTKLPNRRMIFDKLSGLIEENQQFYIVLADIDRFKIINDTYGHDCGDKILIAISDVLLTILGQYGFVGRWGGEEFMLVFLTGDPAKAVELGESLRIAIESMDYTPLGYPDMKTTITLGLFPFSDQMTLDQCIASADEALYRGKEKGRNQVVL